MTQGRPIVVTQRFTNRGHGGSNREASENVREDAELLIVRAARHGDRRAFANLHERFSRMIHAILLAKVPAGEADDLVRFG